MGESRSQCPRTTLDTTQRKTTEWKSMALRAYQRRTKQADSLIAGAYLAETNTRWVRRALSAVFRGAVGKANLILIGESPFGIPAFRRHLALQGG